jgi:multiple RNA-binding domain-containing protein 1
VMSYLIGFSCSIILILYSQMAKHAVSYFDKSFALTSKLSVSLAFSKKDGPPPISEYRPWSKHSVGSSRNQKLQQKDSDRISTNKPAIEEEDSGNPESEAVRKKKEEFLSAMGVSVSSKDKKDAASKSKFWANDDIIPVESNTTAAPVEDANQSKSDSSSSASDSDEEMEVDKATETKKNVSTDMDFLRSKQVKEDILTDDDENNNSGNTSSDSDSDDSSSSDEEDDIANGDGEGDHVQKEPSDSVTNPTEVSSTKDRSNQLTTLEDRLFVRNLPFTTTEEDLFETFSQFGTVSTVHIPVDDTKRNKGYAFITFQSKDDAKLAMETMDGEDFQGRLIHILPARPSADQAEGGDSAHANLTYKEKQALARQKEAEASMKSWSASFMRGDAVVDNISDRLGVSKGDVLNVKDGISSGNAAVRLALGETHIISENIAFFESHGVDISVLEGSKAGKVISDKSKRSNTMMLVKNLPYDTSVEDLTKVFHAIGGDAPQRILLPPSKTAALVEYGHATDARRAFRRLAYKKFKHVPLYLEWAPMMNEVQKAEQAKDSTTSGADDGETVDAADVKKGFIDTEEHTADAYNSQSIYVKNLNFSTTEEQLNAAFTKAGFNPRAIKIPTKSAPIKKQTSAESNEAKQLSMGFGFVEFSSQEEAKKAMKAMHGQLVDAHALEVKLSSKNLTETAAPAVSKSSKNTKIMVRNVPFEATRSELLKLFGSFGQLKKVRLPKKFDGTHRGFAFCEFLTSKEAQNAMATLSRTHLYGRHLVLEWAAEEENEDGKVDVSKVREKAKRDAIRAGLGDAGKGTPKQRKQHLKFD